MGKGRLLGIGIMGLVLPAMALGLSGGFGGGLVGMEFLNGQLEALAARHGADFSPIRLPWEAQVAVWPWSGLGVGLHLVSASGAIHGRAEKTLSAMAVGVEGCGRVSLLFIGLEAGLGAYGAMVSGLIDGKGIAFGGYIAGALPLLSLGGLRLDAKVVWRWLPFHTIRDGEEVITPGNMPAVDFSGLFFSLTLGWSG